MWKKLFFLCFLSTANLIAQDISQLSVVGKAEFLPTEIISNNNRDANGEICSGLMIRTDLDGLSFDSNNGIEKTIHDKPGEYFLFLSPTERLVKIYKQNYKPLDLVLEDYGISLKSGQVWRIKLTGEAKMDVLSIVINTEPEQATIFIDDKDTGAASGNTIQLPIGKHSVRIEKKGYKTINEVIDVSAKNILFRFNLEEIQMVMTTIKSSPSQATIYIDNLNRGITDKDIFLFPGKYKIKISKSGYLDHEDELIVSESGINNFFCELSKNTVSVKLDITPSDSKVYINKEDYSNQKNIELLPGNYKLEIEKEGYRPVSEFLEVVLDKTILKSYTLAPITGILQLTVQPRETRVELYQNGKIVDAWNGSTLKNSLIVGTYELHCTLSGFQHYSSKIEILENKTTNIDIQMEQGEDVVKSVNPKEEFDDIVFVKGSTYSMGTTEGGSDEEPVHTVTLKDFYIGKYEVTNLEFAEFLSEKGNEFIEQWYDIESSESKIYFSEGKYQVKSGYEKYPVVEVTWYGAKAYCEWKGGRLPTEAEWEYAARDGEKYKGNIYSGSNNIVEVAWFDTKSSHEVGQKWPNGLGLYDMSGNVWEWCGDWYDSDYYGESPANNPKGPIEGSEKVLRGGSWYSYYDTQCSIFYRYREDPNSSNDYCGFRVVYPCDIKENASTDDKRIDEIIEDKNESKSETELILVKGSTYSMGTTEGESDEEPVHTVTLKDFYIGKYEVTNLEFAEFLSEKGNEFIEQWYDIESNESRIYFSEGKYQVKSGYEKYPVIEVTWYGAKAYCEWKGGRLPTEAEWEYAARDGDQYKGNIYSGSDNIVEVAWFDTKSSHEVGQKLPNGLGLYDLSGNVWEWCSDWYDSDYYKESPVNNPTGPLEGSEKVLRGGSWYSYSDTQCRVFYRYRENPNSSNDYCGFRIAYTASEYRNPD